MQAIYDLFDLRDSEVSSINQNFFFSNVLFYHDRRYFLLLALISVHILSIFLTIGRF